MVDAQGCGQRGLRADGLLFVIIHWRDRRHRGMSNRPGAQGANIQEPAPKRPRRENQGPAAGVILGREGETAGLRFKVRNLQEGLLQGQPPEELDGGGDQCPHSQRHVSRNVVYIYIYIYIYIEREREREIERERDVLYVMYTHVCIYIYIYIYIYTHIYVSSPHARRGSCTFTEVARSDHMNLGVLSKYKLRKV